jgi:hypothetical protein
LSQDDIFITQAMDVAMVEVVGNGAVHCPRPSEEL